MLSRLLARIDCLIDQITGERDDRRAAKRAQVQPATITPAGSAVGQLQPAVPATGPLVLDLGGPNVGRKWEIRGLAVSDAGNAATAVTGVANWYIGKATQPVVPAANWVPLAPTAWRWTFPVLPNLVTFSSDARTVLPNDRLYCVITGGTPAQVILAQAEVKDFSPADQLIAGVI
jgi:hypothetical protein